ncbi:hypothetical protein TI04_06590 [Achromatium sp. WMS2]|nr:hypothetical protein TI04_06590 [Achromatium sp. WMS2]
MTAENVDVSSKRPQDRDRPDRARPRVETSLTTTDGTAKVRPLYSREALIKRKRSTIARIIRVELEVTLEILNQALGDNCNGKDK